MKMNGETTISTIPKPEKPVRLGRTANGSQVDWEALRQKVLESSARLDWVGDVPTDILEQSWARRAVHVAQEIEDGETGEQIEIAMVRLGKELYGLEADYVFDIRSLDHITSVPRVPDWVAGVVNLRGRIISVMDLHRFLGIPLAEKESEAESATRHLVMVETSTMELALLVDEVLGIEALPNSQIQEAASAGKGIRPEYVRGVFVRNSNTHSAENNNGMLVVLDLQALLVDKSLIIHEELV
jgi:purine-binding chemotaxis protein CheW